MLRPEFCGCVTCPWCTGKPTLRYTTWTGHWLRRLFTRQTVWVCLDCIPHVTPELRRRFGLSPEEPTDA